MFGGNGSNVQRDCEIPKRERNKMKLETKKQITRTAFAGVAAWLCGTIKENQPLSVFFMAVSIGLIISIAFHFLSEKPHDDDE